MKLMESLVVLLYREKKLMKGIFLFLMKSSVLFQKKKYEKITLDFDKKNENFKVILEKNGTISLPPYISKLGF